MYGRGGSTISSPILSVSPFGGNCGCDHITLQWRLRDVPEGRWNIKSMSVPGVYFVFSLEGAVIIWIPFSEMSSINTPYCSSPEIRAAFKCTCSLWERLFPMAIL